VFFSGPFVLDLDGRPCHERVRLIADGSRKSSLIDLREPGRGAGRYEKKRPQPLAKSHRASHVQQSRTLLGNPWFLIREAYGRYVMRV
jgi:hypothetical protein